jgi:Cu+-exporting ATPase
VPLAVLAWVSAWHFSGWEWLSFALATPVVAWSGWPFHRAAALNARHLVATMDTLISVGTLAAWTWSTVVLLAGIREDVYFDAAALITALILLGRYFEARAKRRSGAAIRALLELGAKEARLLRDGAEVLVPVEQLAAGDLFVVRPGEKVATDGVVESGESAVDASRSPARRSTPPAGWSCARPRSVRRRRWRRSRASSRTRRRGRRRCSGSPTASPGSSSRS